MRVLVVGKDKHGGLASFVTEQITALQKAGIIVESYVITSKGLSGHLRNFVDLRRKISTFQPDIIHVHYGLSGLKVNLLRRVPVVTTYHGSDVHCGGWTLRLSQLAMKMSAYNIFVSKKLLNLSEYKHRNARVIPCGVNLEVIKELPREVARTQLNHPKPMVLFSGPFTTKVKNPDLAKAAMKKIPEADLVELKGYTRQEVNLLMNAAGCLLMTSDREGSPQVIKEAMACGTPIVSVDVGDVKDIIGDTEGCYIAERNSEDIADKIRKAFSFKGKTKGRQRIIDLGLDNELVAKQLLEVYNEVLKQ